jgi:membrane protease YdiL (CAAX protease family)
VLEPAAQTIEPVPEEMIAPPADQPPAVLPAERAAAALEVILCSGFPTQIFVITVLAAAGMKMRLADGALSPPFVFALTLLDTVLLVSLIVFFMRSRGESVRDQLFGDRPIGREMLLGLALIPASFFVVIAVLLLVQLVVPSLRNVPHNPLQDLVRSRWDAAIFAFVVMVAGGVREEVQRGFVLRRFERYLGGGAAGLLVFSVLFGLGHLEQGRDIAVATGVLGAFWGAIFLRRRSIAAPMIGHAGFNLAQVLKFLTLGA